MSERVTRTWDGERNPTVAAIATRITSVMRITLMVFMNFDLYSKVIISPSPAGEGRGEGRAIGSDCVWYFN